MNTARPAITLAVAPIERRPPRRPGGPWRPVYPASPWPQRLAEVLATAPALPRRRAARVLGVGVDELDELLAGARRFEDDAAWGEAIERLRVAGMAAEGMGATS